MKRLFRPGLLIVAALAPGAAWAQESPRPEALLERGEALMLAGQSDEAAASFRLALEAERSGRALASVARAEQTQGHMLEAEAHFVEALTFVDERWVRHHRGVIDSALAEVRASISTVRISSNIDGAEVRLNGALMGRTPLREPVRVAVGTATIELRAEGFVTASRSVNVMAFIPTEAHVNLDRVAPLLREEPPAEARCAPGLVLRNGLCFSPEPVDDGSVTPFRWMIYAGAGAALVSASIALGLWVDGNATEEAYLSRCGGASVASACQADWRQTQDALGSQASAINALWVVATLATATAVAGLGFELRDAGRRRARVALTPQGLSLRW